MLCVYIHFCSDFLVIWKNGLIRKLWLILKFKKFRNGQQHLKYSYYLFFFFIFSMFGTDLDGHCNKS